MKTVDNNVSEGDLCMNEVEVRKNNVVHVDASRSSFLDVYRIILCLGVVVYHYTPIRPASGPLMVNGFFVMSGFLLAMEYLRRPFLLSVFYSKKIRRLMPFFILALLSGIFYRIIVMQPLPEKFAWGAFDPVALCMYYNTPTWYMAVELVLLLNAPFFIFLMQKRMRLHLFALVMIVFTAFLFSHVPSGSFFAGGLYFSPIARCFQFLVGMCAACMYEEYKKCAFWNSIATCIVSYGLFVLFMIISIVFMVIKQAEDLHYWNYSFSFTFLSSLFMAILIPFIYNYRLPLSNQVKKLLAYAALLTYPIYLFHVVILWYVSGTLKIVFRTNNQFVLLSLSVLLTIVLSCLLLYLEKHFLRSLLRGKRE